MIALEMNGALASQTDPGEHFPGLSHIY